MITEVDTLLRTYKSERPVRVEALIRNLGIDLEPSAQLDGGISGHIQRRPDGTYVIRTNGNEHEYRRRFTMAHELGHWVLHRSILDRAGGINDTTMYRTDPTEPLYNSHIHLIHEQQANSFAANLLMPDQLVRDVWMEESERTNHPEQVPTLTTMHRAFQVSPSAMRWRLRNLGLQVLDLAAVA